MVGQTIGHYRIVRKIGEGGVGRVYLADDLQLDRPVALKVLAHPSPNADQIARFEREAKAAAALAHPNILATLANPVDALRTGVLLAVQGTSAFGPASLALLRFTGGADRAIAVIIGSALLWMVLPAVAAARRLERADL